MRQRVAICRALIHDPDILLMDEPFSALDAITRDQMNVALSEILETYQKTVIFVTHSIREAAFLSDRVVVMGGRPSTIIARHEDAVSAAAPVRDRGNAGIRQVCRKLAADHRASPSRPPSTSSASSADAGESRAGQIE